MKKVLFVIDSMVLGGSQKILLNCLKVFQSSYQVELMLINRYGVFMDDIPEDVKVYYILNGCKQIPLVDSFKCSFFEFFNLVFSKLFLRGAIYLKYIKWKSNRLIGDNEYDYIIGFQEGPSNYVAANISSKGSKIGWLHSDINMLTRAQTKMETNVYEKLKFIMCVSDSVKERAVFKYPKIESQLRVLYNPIDLDSIRKSSEIILNDKYNDQINFVSIGRLSEEKNIETLILFMAELLLENDKFFLHIIGDGHLRERLEMVANENQISNKVIFHGLLLNPYNHLLRADFFVSASKYEGLPTTILESVFLKKKIIASNISANREILKHYNQSRMFDIGNKQEFINSVFELMSINENCNNDYWVGKVLMKNFLNEFERVVFND